MRAVPFAVILGAGMALSATAQAQDAAAGQKVFAKCKACHTLEEGKNRVGPHLYGIIGRQAGTVEGFKYSDAMKGSGITWTPENISKYLADPKGFIPRNKMVFAGLKDEADRQNLIAYLEKEAGSAQGAAAPAEQTGQQAQQQPDAAMQPQVAAAEPGQQVAALPTHTAQLKDRDGKEVGTVTLTAAQGGVLLEVQANALPPGEHGFHVHQTGACEGDFKSAGGHFTVGEQSNHGLLDGKPHAGDMPNLHVPNDGRQVAEYFLEGVTEQQLFDQDGAAVVVHAGPDDYRTDPAGNSGDRIACAAFAAR